MTQKIAQKIVEKRAKYATSLRATAAAFTPYLSIPPSLFLSLSVTISLSTLRTRKRIRIPAVPVVLGSAGTATDTGNGLAQQAANYDRNLGKCANRAKICDYKT